MVAEREGLGGQREGQFGIGVGIGVCVGCSQERVAVERVRGGVALVAKRVGSGGQREGQFGIGVGIGVCVDCL